MEWAETFGVAWLRHQFERKVEIHFIHPRNKLDSTALKILWLFSEPACRCLPEIRLEQIYRRFDLILTHNQYQVRKYPNARLIPWIPTSVGMLDYARSERKTHLVSGLLSGEREGPPGHKLRYAIFEHLDPRRADALYFVSSRNISKDFFERQPRWRDYVYPCGMRGLLMHARFNLAIESVVEPEYNSEKLVDCLVNRTVPIYYGNCDIPWLDERGILRALNLSEYLDALGSLSDALYDSMVPYIEENYHQARKHLQPTSIGFLAIKQFIAELNVSP